MTYRTAVILLVLLITFAGSAQAAERNRVVYHAQLRLQHKGYNPGPIDGVIGKKTRRAIANFQWDKGLTVNGTLDRATRAALGLSVFGYAQIGAAKLRLFDVPAQAFTVWELLSRVQEMRKVHFDGSKHLTLYEVEGFQIHTGHIIRLIEDECLSPFEISIGEVYVKGQSLKSSHYGEIFAQALAGELEKLHAQRVKEAIRDARKEIVLVCTAAMF